MLRSGDPWGVPCDRSPDLTLTASDAELARALADSAEQPLVAWTPRNPTDLGASIGRAPGHAPAGGYAAPMDVLASDSGSAVNAIVWGASPTTLWWGSPSVPITVEVDGRELWAGPAASVIIANGDFLDGCPIAPKAHPGDGLLDLLIVGLRRSERRGFRFRLARGDHLPHPRIRTARGRSVHLAAERARPVMTDGHSGPAVAELTVHIESDRWSVLL